MNAGMNLRPGSSIRCGQSRICASSASLSSSAFSGDVITKHSKRKQSGSCSSACSSTRPVRIFEERKIPWAMATTSCSRSSVKTSALYDEMLSDWRRVAVQVTTQAQVRTEVVWFNFAPEPMHWASHAGRNAAERQRIKRKAARWAQGYRTMPAGERLAVLSAIMAVEAE